ncbi:unnamed protein product [Prunus armeniaca]|uniref:Uncharacterized protein n=1 Tax=Prunus armeniaca TaxID=36596 RepID=A0A6J5TV82_PRUAR|nr:unnamed protein product [Prunus armeniaca]
MWLLSLPPLRFLLSLLVLRSPQSTGITLPPQPTLAPTVVAISPPYIPIDSFYTELNVNGYKFAEPKHPPEAEPEHPPEIAAAPSKVLQSRGCDQPKNTYQRQRP